MSSCVGGCFLLLAIGISGFLLWHTHFKKAASQFKKIAATNATIEKVDVTSYDQAGKINATLYAPNVKHFQATNTALLTQPKLVLYSAKQAPWTITANSAEAKEDMTQIILRDNVRAHQTLSANNPEITILTEELIVYPKENRAQTTKYIKLIEKGDKNNAIVEAIGAKVNQKTQQVELLSHVKGEYAPRS